MTNPHNVEVICERLVSYLRSTVDDFLRADLVARVTELAERYPHSLDQSLFFLSFFLLCFLVRS